MVPLWASRHLERGKGEGRARRSESGAGVHHGVRHRAEEEAGNKHERRAA